MFFHVLGQNPLRAVAGSHPCYTRLSSQASRGSNPRALCRGGCSARANAKQVIAFQPSSPSAPQQSTAAQLRGIAGQRVWDENQTVQDFFGLTIIRHYIANYNQWDGRCRSPSRSAACRTALLQHFSADRPRKPPWAPEKQALLLL